jgi:hypothetical protein
MGACSSNNRKKSRNEYNNKERSVSEKYSQNTYNEVLLTKSTQSKNELKRKNTNTSIPSLRNNLLNKKSTGINYERGEKIFFKKMDGDNNIQGINNEEYQNLSMKVELFLSLFNLQNISKNQIKVWLCNNKRINNYEILGTTEEISEERIDFGQCFEFDYFFERRQILRINLFQDQQKVYETEVDVPIIMGQNNFIYTKDMINNEINIGTIQFEIKKKVKNQFNNFKSQFLIRVELFDKLTYGEYFILFKKKNNINSSWRVCYKSNEFFPKNGVYTLGNFELDSTILCDSKNDYILMELYNRSTNLLQGVTQFTLEQLENRAMVSLYDDLNSSKQIGKAIINHTFKTIKTFIDYIRGGININLDIAIDYTASNENPNNPNSLHYCLGDMPNDYENAILSCGSIVGYYDKDQIFPVFGFGGIPPGKNKVSHCFNINFEESPDIQLIDNVIRVYKESLNKVTLSGPTFFAPIIEKVMSEIKKNLNECPQENHYEILMILTDGLICDMQETTKLLVDCASLPLSVIIIGIGDADFSMMVTLDGDDIPLTDCDGRVTERDLVQFVEYEKFKKKGNITELNEEVLKEIPRQIEEYYANFGKFYENNN